MFSVNYQDVKTEKAYRGMKADSLFNGCVCFSIFIDDIRFLKKG